MKVPGIAGLTSGFRSSSRNRSTPESIKKYEPFFKMVQQDALHSKGVKVNQYENPISGVVDIVTFSFDLRILQTETAENRMLKMRQMQQQQNINNEVI